MSLLKHKLPSHVFQVVAVATFVLMFAPSVHAAKLKVKVFAPTSAGNVGLGGARVCYTAVAGGGTRSDSKVSDSTGSVTFDDAPQATLVVTSSKSGFVGSQKQIAMGSSDIEESFVLPLGSGGAACSDPPPLVTLTVQVLSQNGAPLSDARVCLLLNNGGSSKLTNSQGRVSFSGVPAQRHRLLVSKTGFEHRDESFTVSGDLSLPVQLREGTSSPPTIGACFNSLTPIPGQTLELSILPIRVTNFRVDGGSSQTTTNRTVTLTATFDRAPGFFRVGETTDLSNSVWQQFNPGTPMTYKLIAIDPRGVAFGLRKIYFQAAVTANTGISSRVDASVTLAPDQISIRTLTGAELQQFLSRALDAGYNFTAGGSIRKLFEGSNSRSFGDAGCLRDTPEMALVPDFFGGFRYVQDDTIRIFEGQALNAFWKITDVGVTPRPDHGSSVVESMSPPSTQGVQQLPFRTVVIRSETKVKQQELFGGPGPACTTSLNNFRIKLIPPMITSLTISGPSNLNVKDALPPRN